MKLVTGEPIHVETRLNPLKMAKKLHLYHDMYGGKDKRLLATGEHALLHVDMNAGRAAPMPDHIAMAFGQIADAQKDLPAPDAGRCGCRHETEIIFIARITHDTYESNAFWINW